MFCKLAATKPTKKRHLGKQDPSKACDERSFTLCCTFAVLVEKQLDGAQRERLLREQHSRCAVPGYYKFDCGLIARLVFCVLFYGLKGETTIVHWNGQKKKYCSPA